MKSTTWILIAVIAATGTASADDAARQQARVAAETLERDAKVTGDDTKYVACGKAYLDIYNADPSSEEALYNAGVCFEEGKSAGAAIAAYEQLRKTAPNSKLVPRTIARLAMLYKRAAILDKAVVLLEEYATKYAGEKDAYSALSDAIELRVALGDDTKHIANAQLFIKLYGAKRPAEAAELMFQLTSAYERKGRDATVKHLRDYIARYGAKGGDDRLVHAYAKLGDLLWQQACPVKPVDGLCIKVVRDRVLPIVRTKPQSTTLPKRCGPAGSGMTIKVVKRTEKPAREALAAMAEAQKAYERKPNADPWARAGYAMTKIAQTDAQLEAFLAITFPANLDFSPAKKQVREASLKRFNDFIANKTKIGGQATQSYEAVLVLKDGTGALAAAARLAFISQGLSNDLLTAEIPKDVRTNEFAADTIKAFCDQMVDVGEPLLKRAIDTYDICIDKASQLGIDDRWSAICKRERAYLGPTTFAATAELVPAIAQILPTRGEPAVKTTRAPTVFADAVAKFAQPVPASYPANAPCTSLAASFETIAKQHKLADAHYMAGLVYARCDKLAEAKTAYDRALQVQANHAAAISNLGELSWRAGAFDAAVKQWNAALVIDPKLFAARVGLASAGIRELRAVRGDDAKRKKLDQEIRLHIASATIHGDNAEPYAQLAILGIDSGEATKPLTRYYANRAAYIDGKAPYVAHALATLRARDEYSSTLAMLQLAAEARPRVEAAKLALGLHYLKLQRWDDAKTELDLLKTKSYELAIARGILARGKGKAADAEARYTEAIALDAARPEAHFNLGVLWKDHVAARDPDRAAARATFRKAADAFRRAGTPEAKLWADDCDKAIAALSP